MRVSKKTEYSEQQLEIAKLAKALGHPARVAIIDHLLKVNACICGDIVNELPLAQSTVSQHLKELKNAGLIKGNIEGNTICYCLDETTLKKLGTYFNTFTSKLIIQDSDCC